MTEAEKRQHRACFTGHRPEKLACSENDIHALLNEAIDKAIDDGYRTFISGMARGVDIMAAEIILKKKAENPSIRLICALPHPDFEKRWNTKWKERFYSILGSADFIKMVSKEYSARGYQIRNEWMVNHSSLLIAIYSGQCRGTQNTITYAMNQGIKTMIRHIPSSTCGGNVSVPDMIHHRT